MVVHDAAMLKKKNGQFCTEAGEYPNSAIPKYLDLSQACGMGENKPTLRRIAGRSSEATEAR
jgi:hypothetical protein